MRSSSLGSKEVSRGAKDRSKRISKANQDPNFDLPSLWYWTATVFSGISPSSISTVDHADFSSSFHIMLIEVNQRSKVFWKVSSEEEESE